MLTVRIRPYTNGPTNRPPSNRHPLGRGEHVVRMPAVELVRRQELDERNGCVERHQEPQGQHREAVPPEAPPDQLPLGREVVALLLGGARSLGGDGERLGGGHHAHSLVPRGARDETRRSRPARRLTGTARLPGECAGPGPPGRGPRGRPRSPRAPPGASGTIPRGTCLARAAHAGGSGPSSAATARSTR